MPGFRLVEVAPRIIQVYFGVFDTTCVRRCVVSTVCRVAGKTFRRFHGIPSFRGNGITLFWWHGVMLRRGIGGTSHRNAGVTFSR